jgi:quercetin dioxygenase-like cupin family protein
MHRMPRPMSIATLLAVATMPETVMPFATTARAHDAAHESVAPLFQGPLPNVDGKTFTSVVVSFPPGASAVPHRHGQAFVYAYVLEGSVRSQLDEGPAVTYRAGEGWVEAPNAHHLLTQNASAAAPARLLVIFISGTGDALKAEDPEARP